MGDSGAKILIEKEFMQFELNLSNNYKAHSQEEYDKVCDMLESFFEQGEISKMYYKHMKKKLKKYDEEFGTTEDEEEIEETGKSKLL